MTDVTVRIRALNDLLRRHGSGGSLIVTSGIAELGPLAIADIVSRMRDDANYSERKDPFGDHAFGSLSWAGRTIFWKIDYYDPTLIWGSSDPSDTSATARILTIMLDGEY